MFVLEAETKLFINRLSELSCNEVTNMLKVLYRHVKEIVQHSPRMSLEFIEFLVTVKHVCKIMIQVEIAAHAFKETHLENCSYYNIHGEINMFLLHAVQYNVNIHFSILFFMG
jgi:predicted choloylglycine hydrolase